MFSRWPAYMHINVYVSLKSTLACEADQRICENVKFIKSGLTALFSYVKLLWMIPQIWLLVGFQLLYVAMYGYNNAATGFAVGERYQGGCLWLHTHVSKLQQYGGPCSGPNYEPGLSYISCKTVTSQIQSKMQQAGRWFLGLVWSALDAFILSVTWNALK